MVVFLNGRFLPETEAVVPVSDRGFLYGDGLFETVRVTRGRPFRWDAHLDRLTRGAAFLKLRLPCPPEELLPAVRRLAEINAIEDAVLRLTLTRGSGPRGYSPRGADHPTLVMTLTSAPVGPVPSARVIISTFRVPAGDPLAAFKTCNKLVQVLARAEADERGADEAVLCNSQGEVAEATASNVFWIRQGTVCTPPVAAGALAGVTRGLVLELCAALGFPTEELTGHPSELAEAEGIFLTRSVAGVVPVIELDRRPVASSPQIARLQAACEAAREGGQFSASCELPHPSPRTH